MHRIDTPHALCVQDISCLGRCSMTVALPVLSTMGIRCSVLPTAVLSTHTAFPAPHIRPLTEDMPDICEHWKTLNVGFDAIEIGYLSGVQQVQNALRILDSFPALTVVDPAIADCGRLYSGISAEQVSCTRQLCRRADILLPNVTEAALLTGLPFRETTDPAYLRELGSGVRELGCKSAVITGICPSAGTTGFYIRTTTGEFSCTAPLVPGHFHGTGDLFASVVTGGILQGSSLETAAALAARFVEKAITATGTPTPHGVEFERCLPWLAAQGKS